MLAMPYRGASIRQHSCPRGTMSSRKLAVQTPSPASWHLSGRRTLNGKIDGADRLYALPTSNGTLLLHRSIAIAQHTLHSSATNLAHGPILLQPSTQSHLRQSAITTTKTPPGRLTPMPLNTYSYACGCRRYIQGRECTCFLNELLAINSPAAFSGPQANYLPFNMENSYPRLGSSSSSSSKSHGLSSSHLYAYSSCRRHDRKYRSRYDCPDHVYRRQKSLYDSHWEAQRLREYEHRKRYGKEWNGYSNGYRG